MLLGYRQKEFGQFSYFLPNYFFQGHHIRIRVVFQILSTSFMWF